MLGNLEFFGELRADQIRNGVIVDSRLSPAARPNGAAFDIFKKSSLYRRLLNAYNGRYDNGPVLRYPTGEFVNGQLGLVTSAGVNFMAANFAGGTSISAFTFHGCGTGKASGGTHTPGTGTNATPIVITDTAHGYTTNDLTTISGVTGNTGENGDWQITVQNANTYTLLGSVGNGAAAGTPLSNRLNGAGDTVLVVENDNGSGGTTRISGTHTSSTNVYTTVATLTFTGSIAVSEWGLFSAVGGGTLWDRRWFNTAGAPAVTAVAALVGAPINVINGDSIQFTYNLTCNAGGS